MISFPKIAVAAGCLVLLASGTAHAQAEWLKGSPEEKLNTLAEIQPGLGTVMMEYSSRFTTMYYAAHGGNWKLADYNRQEMTEIQEVGETTRPARAKPLKAFEEKHLAAIGDAIKGQNIKQFDVAFKEAVKGCNECHADQKFGFIRYELPKAPLSPLSMKP
jgi:hypothetical protein